MPTERQESAYRAAQATTTPLLFGATFACAACRLRFARRATCPECGATDVLLLDRDGRATYRERVRSADPGSGVAALARWAPKSLAFPLVIAMLMVSPAVGMKMLFGDAAPYERTWLIALAIAGILLLVFVVVARTAAARQARTPATKPRRMRVHTAGAADDAIEVSGVARQGTIEIASPIANAPCLAFGLHGATDTADIADAEGGDFDLELDSGERMMVSLEHAVLVVPAAVGAPRPVDDALAELLEDRAIRASAPIPVTEILLRDGDRVTVAGTVLGGATVTLANGQRARVLAGTEAHPVVIRLG